MDQSVIHPRTEYLNVVRLALSKPAIAVYLIVNAKRVNYYLLASVKLETTLGQLASLPLLCLCHSYFRGNRRRKNVEIKSRQDVKRESFKDELYKLFLSTLIFQSYFQKRKLKQRSVIVFKVRVI